MHLHHSELHALVQHLRAQHPQATDPLRQVLDKAERDLIAYNQAQKALRKVNDRDIQAERAHAVQTVFTNPAAAFGAKKPRTPRALLKDGKHLGEEVSAEELMARLGL